MPPVGFGTWPLAGEEARAAVATALEVGLRHIDTAQMYGNEDAVGAALDASALPRASVFVVTKIHPGNFGDGGLDSVRRSLDRLRLDRVDLLLAHWPPPGLSTEATVDRLLECLGQGLTAAIGVSNFNVPMLERAAAHSPVPIAANQVEFHPLLGQERLLAAARRLGSTLTAYCPLARGAVLGNRTVRDVAARTGFTPAQVALRWIVQQGAAAIPMSTKRANMADNLAVLDLELDDADMAALSTATAARRRVVDEPGLAPDWDA